MSKKKNIDRIFKEKFKDFEAAPPAGLWDSIEDRLDQPLQKPKSILPLWLKYVGIAAGIALLFSVYSIWNRDQVATKNNQVVEIENDNNYKSQNTEINKGTEIVDDNNSNSEVIINGRDIVDVKNDLDENAITLTQQENKDRDKTNSNYNHNNKASNSTSIKNSIKTNRLDVNKVSNSSLNKDRTTLALNEKLAGQQNSINKNGLPLGNKNLNESNESLTDNRSNSAISSASNNDTSDQNSVTRKPYSNTTVEIIDPVRGQESLTGTAQMDNDSINLNQPSLEAVAQQELQDDKEEINVPFQKSWTATSMIAPVFSSTASGSSIGEEFVDNDKVGGVNLSYGVAVGYEVSPRLSIRTGVHRMDMSYTTQDVVYKQPFDPGVQLLSIGNFNPTSVFDAGSVASTDIGSSFSQEFLSDNTFSGFQGEISQRLGYLEVPLEVRYKLIDSKFSLNVIGGMSALFLTDNNIAITDNNTKLDLGSDNNFNDFNQSANFGLGLDYAFTKQLGFSIEPVFKYQLSPLRDNIAGFRPYNIGVYSGITYRF